MNSIGYWVECIPIASIKDEPGIYDQSEYHLFDQNDACYKFTYKAMIEPFPEMSCNASTADKAINNIRSRLIELRNSYKLSGTKMPERHNPLTPPNRFRSLSGWMSIYIDLK